MQSTSPSTDYQTLQISCLDSFLHWKQILNCFLQKAFKELQSYDGDIEAWNKEISDMEQRIVVLRQKVADNRAKMRDKATVFQGIMALCNKYAAWVT